MPLYISILLLERVSQKQMLQKQITVLKYNIYDLVKRIERNLHNLTI
jgi:hypothetical protein